MKLTDPIKIGDEVENSAPAPVNPTDLVRLSDLEGVGSEEIVASATELSAIPEATLVDGQKITVRDTGIAYFFRSTAPVDEPFQIVPNDTDGTGAWLPSMNLFLRMFDFPNYLPNDYKSKGLSASFRVLGDNTSSINVKAFSKGSPMWQILSSSFAGDGTVADEWYLRNGVGAVWGVKHKIWHSGNFDPGNIEAALDTINGQVI